MSSNAKKLLEESFGQVGNELEDSLLFRKPNAPTPPPIISNPVQAPITKSEPEVIEKKQLHKSVSKVASNGASTLADKQESNQANSVGEMVEIIRKTVKDIGKEALYVRLTATEKELVKEIVFECQKKRPKLTDNEFGRIAVNYLLLDYQANKQDSLLAKVIDALNA